MPEITVTETQQETLEEIRSDLEASFIDTYGQIRPTDVIQYLLDTYTPPEEQSGSADYERIATAEFPLLQQIATDVEGVPGSGIDTATMRGELLSTLGPEEFAARLAEAEPPEEASSESDSGAAADSEDEGDTDTDADTEDDAASDASGDTGNGSTAGDSTGSAGGPDAVLSAANQLLKEHGDKWREGEGQEPYEVDMPDGSAKQVRTKDDVKQLLFKHY